MYDITPKTNGDAGLGYRDYGNGNGNGNDNDGAVNLVRLVR